MSLYPAPEENGFYGQLDKIKVYGNSAWAVCDEKFVASATGENVGVSLLEVRILEIVDEKWKIVFYNILRRRSW